MRRWVPVLLAIASIGPVGRSARGDDPPPEAPKEAPKEAPGAPAGPAAPVAPTAEQVAAWTTRLQVLAGGYRSLSRVDTVSRFAPTACRMIGAGPRVPVSASKDGTTHGLKLYALWTLDVKAYGALSGFRLEPKDAEAVAATPGVDGCSQVMVKEAFEPVEMKADEKDTSLPDGLRPAVRDGKRWRPGEARGLFVMFRLDPGTPGTDDGWVYGTLTPKREVTEVGRIASCMACHVEAKPGRLFGIPASE